MSLVCRNKSFIRKKGIEGILDPFASGILIIGVNSCTKYLSYFNILPKTYQGVIQLGLETDTLDITGSVTQKKIPTPLSKKKIQLVLKSFIGTWEQTPPIVSNLKYNGKPLRKWKGTLKDEELQKIIESKKRLVQIYDMQYLHHTENKIHFECTVSSGTYIRSLAKDISHQLDNIGVLCKLKRTQIGKFTLDHAISISQENINSLKNPLDSLYFLPTLSVTEAELKHLQEGRLLNNKLLKNDIYKLQCNHIFYGLVSHNNEHIKAHKLEPLCSNL